MISLLFLVAMSQQPTLTLELKPKSTDVLVAEPLRLELKWLSSSRVVLPAVILAEPFTYGYLQIWVTGPEGRREYREVAPPQVGFVDQTITPPAIDRGSPIESTLVLHFGRWVSSNVRGYLFQTPGSYRLTVTYATNNLSASSNTVSVQVKEPDERERPVLQALRGDPSEIRLGGPAAQKLLRQYPDSRYLQGARVEQYLERERQLFRESPSDVEEAPEVRRTQRASAYQGMLDELLAKNWGKYDDARLGLLLRFAQEAGDQAAVERARAEIVERFPDSALAEQIRHK